MQLASSVLLTGAISGAPMPAQAFDSWVSRRDAGVVRQSEDFSCGLAAVATILTHYYNEPVSEAALLAELVETRAENDQVFIERPGVSFADLQRLAEGRGFRALGISLDYRDLEKLRQPVIVALNLEGQAHFTVLRRIESGSSVLIADPSWGNRRLSPREFIGLFVSTPEGQRGRVLIIGSGLGGLDGSDYQRFPEQRIRMLPGMLR